MNNVEMNEKIGKVKDSIGSAMADLVTIQTETKLPPANDSFARAQGLLKKQEYNIVVCGEVKQGKSSFVNSLLGKKLLPVADEVATSQVFRISNSAEESFYLVFEDGTRTKLDNYEQMIRYGTELTPDERDRDPLLVGRTLQLIEVNTPAAFLPPNVHLLDTPGLGALYRSHAEITHRYMATSDAVIFLKAAQDPLVDSEIAFLKEVLAVTPNIMFVQSKIDLFDRETREQMITRNQFLLNEKLGLQSADKQYPFLPFSSKSLLQAAQQSNDAARALLQKASHYDEILSSLSVLLFKTVGDLVCTVALDEAAAFFRRQLNAVQEECKLLTTQSEADKAHILSEKKKRQDEFNSKWGKNGTEFINLNKRLSTIISTGRNRIGNIFSNRGPVFSRFSDRIDALSSKDEIEEFADSLADSFTAAVSSAWQSEITSVQNEINKVLVDCKIGCDQANCGCVVVQEAKDSLVAATMYENVRNYSMGAMFGGTVGTIAACLIPVTGGLSVLPVIIGLWWGGREARKKQIEQQNQRNKSNIRNVLNNYLNQLYEQFMIAPRAGTNSLAEQFFADVKENAEQGLRSIIENEATAFKTECARLDEDAKCSEEEGKKRLAQKRQVLEKLVKLGESIDQISREKNNLAQSIIG